jgi:hypothetical protein
MFNAFKKRSWFHGQLDMQPHLSHCRLLGAFAVSCLYFFVETWLIVFPKVVVGETIHRGMLEYVLCFCAPPFKEQEMRWSRLLSFLNLGSKFEFSEAQ